MRSHLAPPSWLPVTDEHPAHAKIVATLGPASSDPETIGELIEAGADLFRLNFSHGDLDDLAELLRVVRAVSADAAAPIAVFGDLRGPKIRVGPVPDLDEGGGITVCAGQDIVFVGDDRPAGREGDIAVFGTTLPQIVSDVEPGQRVLINDGAVRTIAVDAAPGRTLRCRVTVGGPVTSAKGINLPDSALSVPAITQRDWECVDWAVRHGLDFLALSFVRTADEVLQLKDRLAKLCTPELSWTDPEVGLAIPVIAKIEKPQALDNLDDIVDAADAVMVARGDLGVEMDPAQVPVAQKFIIAKCQERAKPCIVATQMLESMITSATATRAEASDVANAIFDGVDAVMLSGETAVGRHPPLVVKTMDRIIQVAEARINQLPHDPQSTERLNEYPHRSAALAHGAWHIARESGARAVAVWSQRGGMAGYLSHHDFRVPIIAYTSSEVAARRMQILGGVQPVLLHPPESGTLADWTESVERFVMAEGYADEGEAVLLIAGKPLGSTTAQDTLAILRVGDPGSGFRSA